MHQWVEEKSKWLNATNSLNNPQFQVIYYDIYLYPQICEKWNIK